MVESALLCQSLEGQRENNDSTSQANSKYTTSVLPMFYGLASICICSLKQTLRMPSVGSGCIATSTPSISESSSIVESSRIDPQWLQPIFNLWKLSDLLDGTDAVADDSVDSTVELYL